MTHSDTLPATASPIPPHVVEMARKLTANYGISFTPDRLRLWAEAISDVPAGAVSQATMRVIQTEQKPPTIARLRAEINSVHRETRAAAPASTRAQRVVCPLCALSYSVTADSFQHTCDPGAVAHLRTEAGRAQKQAMGLAACTGRAVEARPIQKGLLDEDR